jgi:S1 RNA binding domain protein
MHMQKSIVKFGAFVDIGSTTDGLVHISEIAEEYVRDVNEFVSRGDTVDVVLLKVVGTSKLALSMKAAARASPLLSH